MTGERKMKIKRIIDLVREKPAYGWVLFLGTVGITFVLGLFASSVMERRVESRALFQIAKPVDQWESNNETWGRNYPREYERWKVTADSSFKSKYAGSAMRDSLAEHPEMVVLWAGYAFSREYNQARGHYHAIEDVRNVLRTGVPQPGTCWSCKSSDVPRVMHKMGIKEFYSAKWADIGPEMINPIGCLDCHDPKTMDLRISRPALAEAFQRQGKDITKATHQEMRSLVCAQCHVEYYFKDKQSAYLTFPWDKGTSAEQIESYYDQIEFTDWVHALSKTPMLKAQHPDWELFQKGIHSERGISCADCHMPYRSEGGVKFTDHKIQSPLNNLSNSCEVCHGDRAEELVKNVNDRQDKIAELRAQVEKLLVKAHIEAKTAIDKGATETEMKPVQKLIRHAQWRWDFTVASVGGAFHAPLESARILGSAIEKGQEARLLLAHILDKYGVKTPVPMPDVSTKAKAQAFIGLDMNKLIAEKDEFKKTVIPEWDNKK